MLKQNCEGVTEMNTYAISTRNRSQSKRKHPYSLNIVHRVFDREGGYDRSSRLLHSRTPPSHLQYELPMFKCFAPNFTIQNVDKPHGFMRKFTPDGRYLLSFSQDQHSLDLYQYRGVGAIADLLQNEKKEFVTAADNSLKSLLIRQAAFPSLFVLQTSLRVDYGIAGGFLNREFSIFVDKGRYVLIASMGLSHELPPVEHIFEFPDMYNDIELFFYNFYLVDLAGKFISDFYSYNFDSIQLSHNHGVSVWGLTIAIYSRYRQCIDLFEIDDGKMVKTHTIGPTGAYIRELNEIFSVNDTLVNSMQLTHFKQRILTFMYRRCLSFDDENIQRKKIREFYRDFPKYERMIISKMQLIGKKSLLIRYEQHPDYSDRYLDRSGTHAFSFKLYVFYCIKTQKIINIYFQDSRELLYILRDHLDFFRNVRSLHTGRYPSSTNNNIYSFASFNEMVALLSDPEQRLNPTLPISTQSFSPSPYIDLNLFIYDERQISALERPRIQFSSTDSLCFRDRDTNKPLYRLSLESTPDESSVSYNPNDPRRELVAYIYHPYEPFVISVQKFLQRYVVNFHIHNNATTVSE